MSKVRLLKRLAVPTTIEEVEQLIYQLGELQRESKRLETEMNDEIAEIKAKYEEINRFNNEKISEITDIVYLYAERNRESLLKGNSKTVYFTSGEISWRFSPPSVKIKSVDLVLSNLKAAGLTRFIRVKEEIAKDMILADPEAIKGIKGISIKDSVEFFYIKPFETNLETVVAVR